MHHDATGRALSDFLFCITAHRISHFWGADSQRYLFLCRGTSRFCLGRSTLTCQGSSSIVDSLIVGWGTITTLRSTSEVIADIGTVLRTCMRWILYFVFAVLLFALFLYLKSDSVNDIKVISFESEISQLLGGIKFLAALLVLLNIKRFRWIEDAMVKFTEVLVRNCYTFVFLILALFIAAVFPLYDQLLDQRDSIVVPGADSLNLVENHKHVLQFGLWLLYLLILSGVFVMVNRRWSLEIKKAYLEKEPEKRTQVWNRMFGPIYLVAAAILEYIGWVQSWIAN